MTDYQELCFDGLVGPTHNYAGLSTGNLASCANSKSISRPRDAALQGLEKMALLAQRGFLRAVLPPLERPSLRTLREFGFSGRDEGEIIARAWQDAPEIARACTSASSMWTANAATVAPSSDTVDGLVHFTPANLASKLHRAIEAESTGRILSTVFADDRYFAHHRPLAGGIAMGDEGAANHTRLCPHYSDAGLHVFVYGHVAQDASAPAPARFPARQSREASRTVARLHRLPPEAQLFVQQNPAAIDAGAFHNDVVGVGNRDFYFTHANALLDQPKALDQIRQRYREKFGRELRVLEVAEADVPLADAIRSYLFNSELLSLPDGRHLLVAPQESADNDRVRAYLDALLAAGDSPVAEVVYFNLRESMRNGGGPACLRLRVVLNREERDAISGRVIMDDALHSDLAEWVCRHYRETLAPDDLRDPALWRESCTALDELTQILKLGSIYDFQS